MGDHDTLLNALIGAVATAVLSGFVPFAPVLGGALAAYLEGGERSDGVRVGAISGVIGLALGAVLFVFVFVVFAGIALGGGAPVRFGAFGLLFFVLAAVVGAAYMVGLSTAGGWLGNYVRYETDLGR